MKTHNTLIWVIVYLVTDSPKNLVTCMNVSPGVDIYVRDSPEYSPDCKLKLLESSSDEILVREFSSDLSQGFKKSIILDINWHFSTDFFDLYHLCDCYSYKTKNGYTLGLIKEDQTIIWDPGPSEYAIKVKVTGGNKVCILLQNGYRKIFKRDEKRWFESAEDEYKFRCIDRSVGMDSKRLKSLKSKQENYLKSLILNGSDESVLSDNTGINDPAYTKLDLRDPFNLEILTTDSRDSNDPTKYHFIQIDSSEGHYIFKKGVKCDQVRINGSLIWKYNVRDSLGMYPKSVSYYKPEQLSINFMDDLIVYEKLGSRWKLKSEPKSRVINAAMPESEIWKAGRQVHTKPPELDTHSTNSISQPCTEATADVNNNVSRNTNKNNSNNSSLTSPDSSSSSPSVGNPTSTSVTGPEKTKLNPIELDVSNTKSTETFDFLKKDGFAKYTPKSGYGFSSVKGKTGSGCSGSTVPIWDAKEPTGYATTVVRDGTGSFSSINNVTIFFGDIYRHFIKSNNLFVQDIGIRLYGNDPSNTSKQLDVTQYTEHDNDYLSEFVIKDNIQCTEFRYIHRYFLLNSPKLLSQELTLWKHDSTKHGDQYPKVLKYYWPDNILINFQNFFMIFYKDSEHKWDNGHLFDFKLYGKDSDGNLKEFDTKSYELTQEKEEYLFKFKPEDNCVQVKHKGTELWKHDPDKHGDMYPRKLSYKKDGSRLVIDFEGFFVLCKKDGDKLKANELLIKFYTIDPNDSTKVVELNLSSFRIEEDQDGFYFKMEEGVKCMFITSDITILWKYEPDNHKGKHPSLISYTHSRVLVDFDDFFIMCEKDAGDVWKAVLFSLKIYRLDPKDNTKILKLNISDYKIIDEGKNYKFVPKENVEFSMIKMEGKELWSHDPMLGGGHPTSIIYAKNKKKLLVDYENIFIIYKRDVSGSWDDGIIVEMKLYSKDPNDDSKIVSLRYNQYNLKVEFEHFDFELKEHVECTMVKLSGEEVWKHDPVKHPGKYPRRFVYKGDKKTLSVVFEGFYLFLQKDEDHDLWVSKESITLDILSAKDNNKYKCEEHELFSTFVAKEKFLFGLVKLGDTVIYQPISPCDLAERVLAYKTTGEDITVLDVVLPGSIIKRYTKMESTGSWYQNLTPLYIDVRTEDSGFYFKCTGRDMVSYYTKTGFGFESVVLGRQDIWTAENESDFALKVDVNEMQDSNEVLVYLNSGLTKSFSVEKRRVPKFRNIITSSNSGSLDSTSTSC